MEAAAYSSSSSSSNSSSTSTIYFSAKNTDYQKSFYSSLHLIQGTSSDHKHKKQQGNYNKPYFNKKLHIAPLPPNRSPKVYKVHPIKFKELVQSLTSHPRRIQNLAPPALHLLLDRQQQQPPLPPPPLQQLLPPPTHHSTKSIDADGEEEEDGKLTEDSPFSALYRELITTEPAAANTSSNENMNNYNYNYSNVTRESVITSSSTSLDLNLGSPNTQHCWYSPLFSPATAGNLIATLDHPQRTIL